MNAEQWRSDLAAWAIPEDIMASAEESPWTLPSTVFARRTDRALDNPQGPSYEAAWAALDPPGTVLDVGAGAGAASLPLAPRALAITAVDTSDEMLAEFMARATARGVAAATVLGRWPDVAAEVPIADVVTCHHVLYNVPDLVPFVRALADHARRLVVIEITARHPLTPLNPLWRRFHGLDRPERPTADDAVAIIHGLGLDPTVVRWSRAQVMEYGSFDELVEVTRRRLCLPADRRDDLAAAIREQGDPLETSALPTRDVVTITFDGTAGASGPDLR